MKLTTVDIYPFIMPQNRFEFQKLHYVNEVKDEHRANTLMFLSKFYQNPKKKPLQSGLQL